MADVVAARHQDEIDNITSSVEEAERYWRENYQNYHRFRNFVFNTTLTDEERGKLQELKMPAIEFNITEAYISRLLGEWSKQTPSFSVHSEPTSAPNANIVEFVQGHLRYKLQQANNNSFSDEIYKEALSGGFSVMKVVTDYKNNKSFDQDVYLTKPYDPTLCGFDPLAREPHKGDGRFCYEKFPMTKEEFKEKYPDVVIDTIPFLTTDESFSWAYKKNKTDIVMVIDFYKKKITRETLYFLANQESMTAKEYKELEEKLALDPTNLIPLPAIKRKRKIENVKIVRYRCIEKTVLEYTETNYEELPLIFVDGNSAYLNRASSTNYGIEGQYQKTRAYFYNVEGTQQLKNYAGQKLAAEIENTIMSQTQIAEDAIPDQEAFKLAYTQPQMPMTRVYKHLDKEGNPLPPPTSTPRAPIPPELAQTFGAMDQQSQTILGSYDASLGIQDKQLSGIAIVEGATQSNNAAMPYVIHYLQALTHAAKIILNLIPKYYVTPRTIPIIDIKGDRKYVQINQNVQSGGMSANPEEELNIADCNDPFEVDVKAGTNFEVQQNKALQFITQLAQQFESIKALINSDGLPWLLSNVNIRGSEELKQLATKFQDNMKQQQAQGQQKPDATQQLVQIEGAKVQALKEKNQADAQYKQGQLQLAQEKERRQELEMRLKTFFNHQDHLLDLAKAETARDDKETDRNIALIKAESDDMRAILKL